MSHHRCKCKREKHRCRRKRSCGETKPECDFEKHDYVIIGGGTAGLVLGYLLNKDGLDVVCLEAGEDQDTNPLIFEFGAIGALETNHRNEFFWLENETGTRSNVKHYSGGRVLGGGSSVNSGVNARGNLKNYAKFGGLFANEPYLRNAFNAWETYVGDTQGVRGTTGPVTIYQQPTVEGIQTKLMDGMQAVYLSEFGTNVPIVEDWNSSPGPAMSYATQGFVNPANFTRESASISIIKKTGSDLDIRLESTVTKILFKGKRAVGVEYVQTGKCKKMCARKKVICCAGPRSSTVLQKSGVGGSALLSSFGIPVVIDNDQVGQNFENHIEFFIEITCSDTDNVVVSSQVPNTEGLAFQNFGGWNGLPDFQAGAADEVDFALTSLNLFDPGRSLLFAIFANPTARGQVNILSNDPLHPICPQFNPLNEADIESLIRILDLMVKTTEYVHDNVDANWTVVTDVSDPRKVATTNIDHPHQYNGTCRIGDVVDSNLNVLGAENLMVVDLSVGISPFSTATVAAAFMMGVVGYTVITGNFNPQF